MPQIARIGWVVNFYTFDSFILCLVDRRGKGFIGSAVNQGINLLLPS